MDINELKKGLTFDDLLLKPGFSQILPDQIDTTTQLTRKIKLNIPIISAAMDTVTEAETAISLARQGGLGFIHKNMSLPDQVLEVTKVKKSESGMIVDPITVSPEASLHHVMEVMAYYRVSGVPVLVGKKLVGIITNRDLRFETDLDQKVGQVMTKNKLVTAREGITLEESKTILHKHRIEKLLITNDQGELKGLITIKDIEKLYKYPNSTKDDFGRLLVGAAIGVGDDGIKRAGALLEAGTDILLLDSAHGHSQNVLETINEIKYLFPQAQLLAGNVATSEGAYALIKAGADAIKVGIGPGSICTTRIVAGVGVPQISAIFDVASISNSSGVTLVADGGIKFSGDITKALAAGAQVVMIGSLFAGTDESPGETIFFQSRRYKVYRGMGSLDAMKNIFSSRYLQDTNFSTKFVPEGVVGRVPYRGPISETIYQLIGGLRAGMGYVGAVNINELQKKAEFMQISAASLRESHVHDVTIIKESPNYMLD